jgi:hypothetical protein
LFHEYTSEDASPAIGGISLYGDGVAWNVRWLYDPSGHENDLFWSSGGGGVSWLESIGSTAGLDYDLNESAIVWGYELGSPQIWLADGDGPRLLYGGDDPVETERTTPFFWNGGIVWVRNYNEVMYFDGTTETLLFSAQGASWIQRIEGVSGSDILWAESGDQTFLYDGTEIHALGEGVRSPRLFGGSAVWMKNDGNDDEIFLYEQGQIIQLTDNPYEDRLPVISDLAVAWQVYDGNQWDICLYERQGTRELFNLTGANIGDDLHPEIYQGHLVWQRYDGQDWEIYEAIHLPEPATLFVLMAGSFYLLRTPRRREAS